ncbi:MAG: carbohydrate kinase family protein [Oscillospiraceae bacterium]|nr:carbohydrate kinase family protein [Oscillospiraceae bacterium]
MAYDILCVGTALVDSLIRGFDPEPISAAGYRAESGTLSVGGEAVNEAMAAAKLGVRTGILCSLGEDEAGEMVLGALRRCGVDTGAVVRPREHPTPVTTMFVNADGTRRSITNGAHRYNFHPERFPERLASARAVILGSLFRAPFNEPEVVQAAAEAVHAAGGLLFADTKLPNFRVLTLGDLSASLPLFDCITPNEDEARYYTGQSEPEAMADTFLEKGVKSVIVKLGARGCYYKDRDLSLRLPALPVRAVDATGAGDNFVAGFVCERLRGADIETALRFANACGALCATAVGASTALKSREQVLELLQMYR